MHFRRAPLRCERLNASALAGKAGISVPFDSCNHNSDQRGAHYERGGPVRNGTSLRPSDSGVTFFRRAIE
jgi:hypothetical protein